MMAGPKYGFWSASTHEVRNGIAKKLLGESHIYVTTRFLTCDRFQNRSAHFKTGWPVLKREARASLKYLVIGR